MTSVLQDLKYSFRILAQRPWFTGLVLGILGLGLGVNAAVFSFVNAAIIEALPFDNADRLTTLFGTVQRDTVELRGISYPDYLDWEEQSRSFDAIAVGWAAVTNLTDRELVERTLVEFVSPSYFEVLGVTPEIGRNFTTVENALPQGAMVALVSHDFWRTRFGSDPEILDRRITVNRRSLTVIGVMPDGFRGFDDDVDLWTPLTTVSALIDNRRPEIFEHRDARWLQAFGLLAPGVTVESAQAELDSISQRLAQQYPDSNENRGGQVIPLAEFVLGEFQETLWLLWAAVGFVLLIVCANAINLLLIRMVQRRKEIAVRSSLGAGPLRVLRQLVTEMLVLSLLGGGLGILLGWWGMRVATRLNPVELPGYATARIDPTVIGFVLLLSLVVGVILGIVPTIQMLRTDLNGVLKNAGVSSADGGSGKRRFSLRKLLVMAEVAVAVVVLIGSLLIYRSFQKQRAIDPGFLPENLLTLRLDLPPETYRGDGQANDFANRLLEEVESLPGIGAVTLTSDIPMGGGARAAMIQVEDHLADNPESAVRIYHHRVSPRFFETLGIKLLRGRLFSPTGAEGAADEVIISNKLAELAWPGQDPLGERIGAGDRWQRVVGVVEDVRYRNLVPDPEGYPEDPDIYLPLLERTPLRLGLIARSQIPPDTLVSTLRERIQSLEPAAPVYEVDTMERLHQRQTRIGRFASTLFGVFGLLAFVFATLGIYGVVSYSVNQRTTEIGLRMALGATRRDIFRPVLAEGLVIAVVGLGLGMVGALSLTRVLESLLYGIASTDLISFILALGSLFIVTVVACYFPARRAMNLAPTAALKYE